MALAKEFNRFCKETEAFHPAKGSGMRRNPVTLSRQMDEAGFPHVFDYDFAMCLWTEKEQPKGRERLRVTDEEVEEIRDLFEKVVCHTQKPPICWVWNK
jgi:hypothetical protein